MGISKILTGIYTGTGILVGVDAINNFIEGNYELAAVEASLAFYIGATKYYDFKKEKIIDKSKDIALEVSSKALEVKNKTDLQFKGLFDKINDLERKVQ